MSCVFQRVTLLVTIRRCFWHWFEVKWGISVVCHRLMRSWWLPTDISRNYFISNAGDLGQMPVNVKAVPLISYILIIAKISCDFLNYDSWDLLQDLMLFICIYNGFIHLLLLFTVINDMISEYFWHLWCCLLTDGCIFLTSMNLIASFEHFYMATYFLLPPLSALLLLWLQLIL